MAKVAVGYCRISEDPEGQAIGVGRQRRDNATLAKREGFELVQSHEDNYLAPSIACMPVSISSGEYPMSCSHASAGKRRRSRSRA